MKRGEHRFYKQSRPTKHKLSLRGVFLFIFNLALLCGTGYGLFIVFVSDRFAVTNVVVRGTEFIPSQDVLDNVTTTLSKETFLWLPTSNIHLISKDEILKGLSEEYVFTKLDIDKILPNTISITIQEKDILYTVLTNEFEYLIDTQGEVVRKLSTFRSRPTILSLLPEKEKQTIEQVSTFNQNSSFPILHFTNVEQFSMSQKVLSPDSLLLISEILLAHQQKIIDVFSISFDQALPQSITITTTKGYDILVSTQHSFEDQFKKCKVVLEQEIREKEGRLDYIDIRLGNNIYYKYK